MLAVTVSCFGSLYFAILRLSKAAALAKLLSHCNEIRVSRFTSEISLLELFLSPLWRDGGGRDLASDMHEITVTDRRDLPFGKKRECRYHCQESAPDGITVLDGVLFELHRQKISSREAAVGTLNVARTL